MMPHPLMMILMKKAVKQVVREGGGEPHLVNIINIIVVIILIIIIVIIILIIIIIIIIVIIIMIIGEASCEGRRRLASPREPD